MSGWLLRSPFGQKRAGITLLELLIVIAIVGILTATLLAVIPRVKEQARIANCISNLGQIGRAMIMYRNDWEQAWPMTLTANYDGDPKGGFHSIGGGLSDNYLREREVFLCRSDPHLRQILGIPPPFVNSSYIYLLGFGPEFSGRGSYTIIHRQNQLKQEKIRDFLLKYGEEAIIVEDPHHYLAEPIESRLQVVLLADSSVKKMDYMSVLRQMRDISLPTGGR
jgi:prepilin-type N-terminal cleavage/methylation domain-containing protein